jgi:hypothetical protein
LGNLAVVQTGQTKHSVTVFLREKRERGQDTDMGHAHSQPVTDDQTAKYQQAVELLRVGNHGQDYDDVLHRFARLL